MPAPPPDPVLATNAVGLRFSSPLGLAAGFDKDARAVPALGTLGFGHVEIGTVTPRPQPGNPRPRIFRLRTERALINRLGFPSQGLDAVAKRLERRPKSLIVGANVGCNRAARDPAGDIVAGIERLGGLVDYVCVNVSSPNTPGLRDLQTGPALDTLLAKANAARGKVEDATGRKLPMFLKIAPDLSHDDLRDLAERVIRRPVDGLSITNTTVARPAMLTSPHRRETGGLSGPPLMASSTWALATLYGLLPRSIDLVGIGGVSSAADAWTKLIAGASLIQLYTGFVFQGTRLLRNIHRGLVQRMEEQGYGALSELVGTAHEAISNEGPNA